MDHNAGSPHLVFRSVREPKPLEVGVLADGSLSFKAEQGTSPARAFVISMPKAGTYLLAAVLRRLGLADLEVHLSSFTFSDYRGQTVSEKLYKAREHVYELPLEFSASLIRPGQFGVGHIPYNPEHSRLLASFVRILVVRELRDSFVSYMRFEAKRMAGDQGRHPGRRAWAEATDPRVRMAAFLRDFGAELTDTYRAVAPWAEDPGVLRFSFEELLGDAGRAAQVDAIQRIRGAVGAAGDDDPEAILSESIGVETLTFSGGRTRYEEFWSDEAEEQFVQLGGEALNEKLGYRPRHT